MDVNQPDAYIVTSDFMFLATNTIGQQNIFADVPIVVV